MDKQRFDRLAADGYDRIPLVADCPADLDTPLSAYLKLTDPQARRNTFLLESVTGGEHSARWSFVGLPARTLLRARGDRVEVIEDDRVVETAEGDALGFVRGWLARTRCAPAVSERGARLPRFTGGLVGCLAYDLVRGIERKLAAAHDGRPDPIGVPDLLMLVVDELAILDNVSGRLQLVVHVDPHAPDGHARGLRRLAELRARLAQPARLPPDAGNDDSDAAVARVVPGAPGANASAQVIRDFDKDDYLRAVAQAKEYVAAGDLMQVQIGQCLRRPFDRPPLSLYRALRSINPSPYMYYYDFGDFHVAGASPEILVRQERRDDGFVVTIRPIAGTRRRGATPAQDAALAQELLADPKECAEHLMLIDLARNDVGRVAEIGSVRVTDTMAIERYSHVMHIVSNVEGRLAPGLDTIDVLRASFPAGTLTGAPKVRAMQVIDELEPQRRGLYGGACGWIGWQGEMDLAIAIRTGLLKDGWLYAQAAAGIVHDSVPEAEWQETESKARAVLHAAELADAGFVG